MLIITGATGQLGRQIAELLLTKVPPTEIGLSVRDETKVSQKLRESGVRIRLGSYDNPESLAFSFENATRVLIISSNGSSDPISSHKNAIDAAKVVGATRIIYTGHMAAASNSLFPPMITHAATKKLLEDSGVDFTFLANGFYMESLMWLIGEGFKTGIIAAPLDGPISWTAHEDLAAAATAALIADDFDDFNVSLTGSEALNLDDVAKIVTELTGRNIKRVVISDEEYIEKLTNLGLPKFRIDISMGLFRAARRGEFVSVDPTLEKILGRNPVNVREHLASNIQSFE
ncbi:hypothetical protein HK100_012289 [Physocladia obscura]|uniref:NmrA-like domain-containing protein n=1 Tax=Physocladia obscura TaxID=109957 RepID=A0AAD5XCK6_9FUNG|nr:hypothetical protein HK100_012289 [Physocladia obscura]